MAGGSGPTRAVRIEADGGSRGNPGKAAYGAVLFDAATGEVIAERAETIGIATNNVAEYHGLIAGLELYGEHSPGAELEVRMDSKLVVQQMSGNWKIKHPDMRPLALKAKRLAPADTVYTWIPRAQNTYADRILNEALDAAAGSVKEASPPRGGGLPTIRGRRLGLPPDPATAAPPPRAGAASEATTGSRGWPTTQDSGPPTTLLLVRHGSTAHTVEKRFSSGLKGANPGLSDEGRAQVRATADWLAPLGERIDVLVTSPVRRSEESAQILSERLGLPMHVEAGLAEMEFGSWDGMTFAEVGEQHRDDLDTWLGSLDYAPGGGESFTTVQQRVHDSLERLLGEHPSKTVLAVSHVTPIKVLVARVLGAPLDAVYRMEMAPASVTVLSFFADGSASMRMFNARPTDLSL
ncbi:MAG TPA: bifunctional RNase H/acid phosphatase [Nocardioidaceae bacterium]|nr:bifunctional RNase H/acid phosphatase [Nocardioidaceae bacterium]